MQLSRSGNRRYIVCRELRGKPGLSICEANSHSPADKAMCLYTQGRQLHEILDRVDNMKIFIAKTLMPQ